MIAWAQSIVRHIIRKENGFRILRVVRRGPETIEIETQVDGVRPVDHIMIRIDPDPPYLHF